MIEGMLICMAVGPAIALAIDHNIIALGLSLVMVICMIIGIQLEKKVNKKLGLYRLGTL